MAYTPTNWTTGDTITAAKLNKIEQGIADGGGGGALVIECNSSFIDAIESNSSLDKTFEEIHTALSSGTPCYIHVENGNSDTAYGAAMLPVVATYKYLNVYRVIASGWRIAVISSTTSLSHPTAVIFTASSLSDYPVFYRNVCPSSSTT